MSETNTTVIEKPTLGLDSLYFGDDYLFVKTPDNTIYRIHKERDECGDFNPRTNDDGNLGTMYCWNRYHTLGDKHKFEEPLDFVRDALFKAVYDAPYHGMPVIKAIENGKFRDLKFVDETDEETGKPVRALYSRMTDDSEFERLDYVTNAWPCEPKDITPDFVQGCIDELTIGQSMSILKELDNYCIMPLYLLDHSGITMSVSSFNDPWDSGCVGYISCTRDRAMELWCKKPEDFSTPTEWKERAKEEMTGEVKTYDIFIRGDVFGVIIEKCIATQEDLEIWGDDITELSDGCFDDYESCWGFFYDHDAEDFVTDIIGDEFQLWPFEVELPIGPKAKQAAFEAAFWSTMKEHFGHSIDVRATEGSGEAYVFCRDCKKVLLDESKYTISPRIVYPKAS